MKIERSQSRHTGTALAAYSQVVRAGSLVTTAGLIGLDSDGKGRRRRRCRGAGA